MTSKQRAYLKGLAMNIDPCLNVGKDGYTPAITEAVQEAIEKNELIKLGILKNCADDPREVAAMIADRTHAEVVQVIGKKIILYKQAKKEENRKIVLPK